ncbi:histidine--tRNA ligase [Candidatus Saccharibacteria bacterium]|nr:histidine--tRNA ligase [Candidatus Saccharibacteria bacterium]
MSKINTKVLSGFVEHLPNVQLEFDAMRQVIFDVYKAHGFLPIDTPLIYASKVLLAKAGGETEKQIYKVLKGDNDLSLRFDLTVPLARYIVEHAGQLNFPFKVAQIGKVYRGERAQLGRSREFYQCDADIIGKDTLDIAYDAEAISLIMDIYQKLALGKFTIYVSNRKLLAGFLQGMALKDKQVAILHIIDKVKKISASDFKAELKKIGLSDAQVTELTEFINLKTLQGFTLQNETFQQGVAETTTVIDLLGKMGVGKHVQLDLQIVRGLDYYTGMVFETTLDDMPEVGSVAGGGRYENLVSNYTQDTYPGVGVSIGLTRLFAALQKAGKVGAGAVSPVNVMILPFSSAEFEFSYKLAETLRMSGKRVDILVQDMPIKKKLRYADKANVANVIVIGSDEVKSGRVLVKNMQSGEVNDLDEFLRS